MRTISASGSAFGLALLAVVAGGCHRGPKTPEAAYLQLERAVAAGDAASFYPLLDQPTRWAIESTLHDQRLMRTIIAAKYPEADAKKELARLAFAEEADPTRYFVRVNQDRHTVESLRKRLGSVSGPVKTKVMAADDIYVARQDGMPFRFHRNANGTWGFSELESEWSLERDKASHAVKTVRDNAALYQKADTQ
ncbi:MAG TPA: hypothetical protein VHB97_21345 [Polyangia bacterium]|jgi:16S rRNA C967 or C1407 C5-methylase (RsmB/RsmF family)|nr:hypothetical protein [Polyangia bacterium]